jgi:hypothetical protein
MNRKLKLMLGSVVVVAALAAVIATGAVRTSAAPFADSEAPITGDALGRASAAALAHTGGGTVTDTEVGDEEGYYEVEVTLDDGRQVDVHLGADFAVLGQEAEDADSDEGGQDD